MKLLILTFSILLLSSCTITTQEVEEQKKICELTWQELRLNNLWYSGWCANKTDKVQDCIDSYIDAIDEKYNNPDTVSDLREDDYSTVVKTCNETFWTPKQ